MNSETNTRRYWLKENGTWSEVGIEVFKQAELRAGFRSNTKNDTATGGFTSSVTSVVGRITYGEISAEKYGHDPDFLKAVQVTASTSPAAS